MEETWEMGEKMDSIKMVSIDLPKVGFGVVCMPVLVNAFHDCFGDARNVKASILQKGEAVAEIAMD